MMRLHLIRHAVVEAAARRSYYGALDVRVCPDALLTEAARFATLATMLPRPAQWVVTPLCRTQDTARAIFRAGYPETPWQMEPRLQEQHLGDWQGLNHATLPPLLRHPEHPFWPLAAEEDPPGGESWPVVIARVGAAIEALAATHPDAEVVAVAHGGSIRAAIAHAMDVPARAVLHLAIENLSVSRLERHPQGWRVVGVNAIPGG